MRTTFAKLTAILLLVFCFGGQTLSAKVKVRKISYGAWAYYNRCLITHTLANAQELPTTQCVTGI